MRTDDEFRFWSEKVKGEGDETLGKGALPDNWTKVIVLKSKGDLETLFSIGFINADGNTMISKSERKVGDGLFGMRMGPEDCEFFIVSNQGEVALEFAYYVNIDAKLKAEIDLY
ncbi:MAG: hypothetical protein PHY30_00665 [Candidatus Pacebacteria bacterium]|nr:hypothetical protein [Candidatus Paceibacterota bacterium]